MNNTIRLGEILQEVPSAPNQVVHISAGGLNRKEGFSIHYSHEWDSYLVLNTVTTDPVRVDVTIQERLVLTTLCDDWQECESNVEPVAWDIDLGIVFYALEKDAGYEGIPAYCHILWDSLAAEKRPAQKDRWIVEGRTRADDTIWHWKFAGDQYDWCTMETEAAAQDALQSLIEDYEMDPNKLRYRKLPEREPIGTCSA